MSLNDYYESLDQMAATLAHEVKNPISIVKANIDLLELCNTDAQFSRNFKVMRAELDKVTELLHGFIRFSMPASESMMPVSINDMLESLADELRSFCGFAAVELSAEQDLSLLCDGEKLRRALLNLLKNSAEAIEEETPENGRIAIEAKLSQDDSQLVIVIEDNGVGLSPDEIMLINKPFFTTKPKGSGLGFQIASSIIKEHGGTIEIASEKHQGCKILVKLPVK